MRCTDDQQVLQASSGSPMLTALHAGSRNIAFLLFCGLLAGPGPQDLVVAGPGAPWDR